jgi:hypothetical protein
VSGDGIGIELLFEDHMSGPAAQIRSQILVMRAELLQLKEMRLDAKMREDAEAIKSLGNDIARMGLEAQKAKVELDRLQSAEPPHKTASGKIAGGEFLSELRGDLFGTFTAATLVANAIERIGEGISEVAHRVVDAGIEVAKFAVEASEMRENATTAYDVLLGSAEEGEKMYRAIEAVAVGGHLAIARAQTMAQALMVEGMKQTDTVAATVQAIGVLERAGPEGSAEKLQRVIARSLTSGHFQATPKALAGVAQMPDLMAELAKRLHQPVAAIESEFKAGKIAADVGIAALVDSVNWGKVGDIAQKKLTLKDVWTDFGNAFTRMLDDINVTPIIQAFENLIWVINGGASGATDFKDALKSSLDNVASWIGARVDDITIAFLKIELFLLQNEPKLKKYFDQFKASIEKINWDDWKLKIEDVGGAIMAMAHAIQLAASALEKMDTLRHNVGTWGDSPDKAGNVIGQGMMNAVRGGLEADTVAPIREHKLTPHAEGGVVLQPAPGEVLASVAPGEVIVPQGGGTDGGGKSVHVGGVQIHLTVQGHLAPDVQRQIETLSTHALEDAFERVALELATEAA